MGPAKPDMVPEMVDATPDNAQTNCPSTWRNLRPDTSTASTGTKPLKESNVGVQAVERQAISTQTDDAGAVKKATGKQVDQAAARISAASLNKVADVIAVELDRAIIEHLELQPLLQTMAQGPVQPPGLLHTLTPFSNPALTDTRTNSQNGRHHNGSMDGGDVSLETVPVSLATANGTADDLNEPQPMPINPRYKDLVVTCLSWSCTGSFLAASFGRYDIPGWCTDIGALAAWNVTGRRVNPYKPDTLIDVDVCLMCCAFHPEHPALIAGGTFNGDVYVWDLGQQGDPQKGKSEALCEVRHQEPVRAISWHYSLDAYAQYGNRTQAYQLVSLGADGKLLIWAWHKMGQPIYAYQLLWPSPAHDVKIRWGGTCMSFAAAQLMSPPTTTTASGNARAKLSNVTLSGHQFMVGTEGGRIFRCSYDLNRSTVKEFQKSLAAGEKLDMRCPITEASYQQHAGPVQGIHCSPFQPMLLLSAGMDGGIRLYHSLRSSPSLVLEPTTCSITQVQWSCTRPLVFAAAAGDGNVYIYDLLQVPKGQLVTPCITLDACGGCIAKRPAATSLEFNSKRPELFTTCAGPIITVWKLPSSLTTMRPGELQLLKRIAMADNAIEALQL